MTLGLGAMYQISSLQAAFPQYGLAWIWGLTYVLRLHGTQLVSQGEYELFRGLFRTAVMYSFLLILAVAASVIPYGEALSFHQAEQACEYASNLACLPHYEHIFGGGGSGGDSLQQSFMRFFVPVLIARCFYQAWGASNLESEVLRVPRRQQYEHTQKIRGLPAATATPSTPPQMSYSLSRIKEATPNAEALNPEP